MHPSVKARHPGGEYARGSLREAPRGRFQRIKQSLFLFLTHCHGGICFIDLCCKKSKVMKPNYELQMNICSDLIRVAVAAKFLESPS